MLPAFISAEDPSRRQKSNDVKPRGMRKKPSSGKENIPTKENSVKPTRIPGPQKVGSIGRKVENKEQSMAGKAVQSQKPNTAVQTRSKAKPVPDFGKIHQQWDKTLSKGKAMKKKPLTLIDPFNLTNANSEKRTTTTTASGKGHDNNDGFQADPAAYQSILDGKLSMVPPGKVERKTIAVPRRNVILKDAPRGFVQDFKVDFKQDSNSLKAILQERDAINTPARGSSTFGPIKRMTFAGVSRTKPYNKVSSDQEKRNTMFYNERLEKFEQLTFEQKLTAIINSRPGLSHARRQTSAATGVGAGNGNSLHKSRQPDATNKRLAAAPDNTMSALADSTGKFVNQTTETKKTEHSAHKPECTLSKIAGETPSASRPKPKLPGQLCQVNFISPRRETPRNGVNSKFEIKSPSAGIKRLTNANPIRNPSSGTKAQKTGSVLPKGATRLTAEARYNIQHGLPLPPKERRYEFVDLSKPRTMPPRGSNTAGNNTKKGDIDAATPAAQLQHLESSGKTKKSVRWADVLERRKSSARELNFDQEPQETKSQLIETQQAVQSTNLQNAQEQQQQHHRQLLEDTLISRVLRNIEATRGHAQTTTVHANGMPKPFINPSVIPNKVALNMETDDWNAQTPKDASKIDQIPLYIEPKSVIDRAMDRLRVEYVKFTPPAAAKSFRDAPQCPSSRRRWARTPHAKEEADRLSASMNLDSTIIDQPVLTVNGAAPSQPQSDIEGNRRLTEKTTENVTDDTRLRSLTSQEQAPIHRVKTIQNLADTDAIDNSDLSENEWKSGVDLSSGILPVLDQINRLSIRDDIKRVFALRTLSFASPRVVDRLTATSTKSGSDSSLYFASKGTEKTKGQPDYASDSGVYRNERVVPEAFNLTSKPHALKDEARPSHHTVHSDSSVSSSEFPHRLPIGSDSERTSHTQTLTGVRGQTNGGVIYSHAPMRTNTSSYASNHRQFQQHFSSRHVPNKAQMVIDAMRPAELPLEHQILTKTSDSLASQGTSKSKISAIVDQYMKPVRSMMDNAFTSHLSNQAIKEKVPLLVSNENNPMLSQSINHAVLHSSASSLSSDQPISNARKRLDSGTSSSFENSNNTGSAFRRVPAVSSSKTEPGRSYADRALRIECPSTPEYCKPALLDSEVAYHTKFLEVATRIGTRKIEQRNCRDPVAKILSDGDDYRFIPITD